MKPEEALEILEEIKELDDSIYQYNQEYMYALDLAIIAIKKRYRSSSVIYNR